MDSMNFADLVTKKAISLRNEHLRNEDLDVLVDVLQKSDVLEELYLNGNYFTLADGKFTDALAHNRTLKVLHLGYNQIGDEGAKRLADALKANNTLKMLSLQSNEIGDEGAKHIAAALMENETLEAISFAWNKIGDEGAKSLANCFMVNQSLREVDLWGNKITDNGAQKLIEALKWNHGIMLRGNPCISEHVKAEIKDLTMEGNPISRRVEAEINDLLKDPKREVPHAQMKHVREEVATLKTALAAKEKRIDIMTTSIRFPQEQILNFIDPVDLTRDEIESSNKRPRMESNLAIKHQQNQQYTQRLVQVKQEKNATEANLKSVQEGKEAAETSLNDTREDLEDANETVQQQLLATDIWQGRFNELAELVRAGEADDAAIAEIRNRSLACGF